VVLFCPSLWHAPLLPFGQFAADLDHGFEVVGRCGRRDRAGGREDEAIHVAARLEDLGDLGAHRFGIAAQQGIDRVDVALDEDPAIEEIDGLFDVDVAERWRIEALDA